MNDNAPGEISIFLRGLPWWRLVVYFNGACNLPLLEGGAWRNVVLKKIV
jgi:hypothetical protein